MVLCDGAARAFLAEERPVRPTVPASSGLHIRTLGDWSEPGLLTAAGLSSGISPRQPIHLARVSESVGALGPIAAEHLRMTVDSRIMNAGDRNTS